MKHPIGLARGHDGKAASTIEIPLGISKPLVIIILSADYFGALFRPQFSQQMDAEGLKMSGPLRRGVL